jgi:hypothetical protein
MAAAVLCSINDPNSRKLADSLPGKLTFIRQELALIGR